MPSKRAGELIDELLIEPESPVGRTISYYENLGHYEIPVEMVTSEPVSEPKFLDSLQPPVIDNGWSWGLGKKIQKDKPEKTKKVLAITPRGSW